jgi:hypothetical protein
VAQVEMRPLGEQPEMQEAEGKGVLVALDHFFVVHQHKRFRAALGEMVVERVAQTLEHPLLHDLSGLPGAAVLAQQMMDSRGHLKLTHVQINRLLLKVGMIQELQRLYYSQVHLKIQTLAGL